MGSSQDTPNILFVCTDQERYDLSAPGGPEVETPAADRLAREGLRCEHAFTPTAMCSPARASILTGRYPHNHGVLSNQTRRFIPKVPAAGIPTYGDLLDPTNYTLRWVGRWEFRESSAADHGFDQVAGGHHRYDQTLDGEGYRAFADRRGVDPESVTVDWCESAPSSFRKSPGNAGVTELPAEATLTTYLAERTIACLEDLAEAGDPFYLRLNLPGPHHPYVVPASYAERYDPAAIEPWPSFAESFEGKPGIHRHHGEYYGCQDLSWNVWAPIVAHYFAFVTQLEEQIGRILEAVDDLGLTEDTVVIRTTDHGDFAGSHRLWDKGPMMYDDIYRVPFFVRWPGVVEPGRVADSFVQTLDIMPTICELAGLAAPSIDGESLVPFLRGADHRDAAVAEYHGEPETLYTQRMIRTNRFKFVFNGPDRNELYDLREDPHELNNRIDHPDLESVRLTLADRLGDWMEETGDDISIRRYRQRCC